MPLTAKDILLGGVLPVLVAALVMLMARRLSSSSNSDRHAASLALLAGFLVGYGSLSLGPWIPTAHWHWLPSVLLVAAIVGPISCAVGVLFVERVALCLLVALVAGWVLVPDWEDLVPSTNVHLATFVAYVVVWTLLFRPLLTRHPGPALPVVLWATMTAAAIVLALSGSLRFGQIGIALSGALFGIVVIALVWRETNHLNGVSLLFSVAVVGALLIGRVNSFSEVPLAAYLLIPVAPLLVWGASVGPPAQLTGVKRFGVVCAIPFILLAIAVAISAIAELRGGGEY